MRKRKQNAFDNIDVLNPPAQRKKNTPHECFIMAKENKLCFIKVQEESSKI